MSYWISTFSWGFKSKSLFFSFLIWDINSIIIDNGEYWDEVLSCIWIKFSTEYDKAEKGKGIKREIEAINEGEVMCNYSQMVLDNGRLEGMSQGLSQGRLNGLHEAYIKMYLSNILTLDRAAKECNVSNEQFISLVEDYKKKGILIK